MRKCDDDMQLNQEARSDVDQSAALSEGDPIGGIGAFTGQQAPVGHVIVSEKGYILDANLAALRELGVSRHALIDKPITQFVSETDRGLCRRYHSQLFETGEPQQCQLRMVKGDGKIFWAKLTAVITRDAADAFVCHIILENITEIRQMARMMRENEERFRMIFNNMSSGVVVYQAVDDGGDFLIMDLNPSAERIEKITREDVIGKRLTEMFPAVKETGIFEVIQRVWRTGDAEHFPVTFYKDNRIEGWRENWIYRLPSGEVVAVYDDLTAQKQAEAGRDRLLAAIEQVAEAVVITDIEGTIQYVNSAFERMTGYSREEALGQNPRILKSGKQDHFFYQAMWETLERGETWYGRFVNRKKDGTCFTEEAVISPVKDITGRTVNYVAIKTDITEELIWEEQLRQSQKMEAVGQLAGGIAHDFNNILQTITGYCQILVENMDQCIAGKKPPNCVAHQADVMEINKAAQYAAELTSKLLTFSRKQPAVFRKIDLKTLVEEEIRMFRRIVGDDIALKFNLASDPLLVRADASQIMQIMLNLIVNARDAMPEGGVVTISTERIQVKAENIPRSMHARAGEFTCLSIADTGIGMTEQQMAHIFEPFYTTKENGQGTGLGLAVVNGIVQNHGGWIDVSSKVGSGSVFRIFLPIVDEAASDVSPDSTEETKLRILLVEDDPVVRELTAEILRCAGYAVSVADNVNEAKELFAHMVGAFDLLFIDVVLPDGN